MTSDNIIVECGKCKNTDCYIKLCDSHWILLVNNKKNQIVFKKGQHIFLEGHLIFGVYFIQEGKVKVNSSNLDGKKQIVRLATDGHILGHLGSQGETYPIEAVTMEDSRICFFDNQTMHDALMANPQFTFNMMMFYSKELRKIEQRTKFFAQMTVEEKIIFALLHVASTFGISKKEKALNVIISRQDLAEIAGTNSEQISRTLTSLNQQNLIHIRGKEIIMSDYQGLKNCISRYKISLF